MTVGVAIITYKDIQKLERSLPLILKSTIHPKILVFNSSSGDGCIEFAKKLGVQTLVIPRSEMNHGTARELSRKALGTDIVVMMTPDAYAEDPKMLEKLVKPIMEGKAAISYARQIGNESANIIANFGREFNFPEISNFRGIEDAPKYGVYTAFCSDACTAYLNSTLDKIGGFRWTLSGEDAIAGAMIIKKGYKIAYVADAIVHHSHNYTPLREFVRHFDTGMYRLQWHNVLNLGGGSDQKRGASYAMALFTYVAKNEPQMLLTAFLQLAFGWLGYQFGKICYHRAPLWLYKAISPADFFWNSTDFKNGRWYEEAK